MADEFDLDKYVASLKARPPLTYRVAANGISAEPVPGTGITDEQKAIIDLYDRFNGLFEYLIKKEHGDRERFLTAFNSGVQPP